jgi:putative mRNA 3-end processing factor
MKSPLIIFTPKGLYCPAGDFYIDPWRPVEQAVVSHAHADHAYKGMKHYHATPLSAAVMRVRLGKDIDVSSHPYGETFHFGPVGVSLHPAGHVPGSAQIRVEYAGRVWIATGDYKRMHDGISEPFEQLEGEGIISEGTFGLPIFKWQPQSEVMTEIESWWNANREAGKASILYGYSFGKAQRLQKALGGKGVIYGHGAVMNISNALREAGLELPHLESVHDVREKFDYAGSLILAPPGAMDSPWIRRFGDAEEATVSGWMAVRASRRWRSLARGFVMSDHADWPDLIRTIDDSGAKFAQIFCGYTAVLSRYLREERGLEAPDKPAREVPRFITEDGEENING